jgi:hypothetical protein
MPKQADDVAIDLPTIVAIAIVSWTSATILHEIVGHGGACLLVGGEARAVSTTELYCAGVAGGEYKLVAAAGSLANLVAALGCFALSRFASRFSATLDYFLWLFMSTNMFHAGSYMLIGPFTGYGDWSYVIQGFEPALLWRLLVTATGYGICYFGMRLAALPQWGGLLGQDLEERKRRMHLLTRVPLGTALIVNLVAGLFSPLQIRWVLMTILLAPLVLLWLVNLPYWPGFGQSITAVPLRRSIAWWVAGAVFCIFFIAVLGPGMGSFSGHVLARP